jgi:hypothetical protein
MERCSADMVSKHLGVAFRQWQKLIKTAVFHCMIVQMTNEQPANSCLFCFQTQLERKKGKCPNEQGHNEMFIGSHVSQ